VALRNFDLDQAITFGQAALERETRNPFIYFHIGGAHLGNALLAPDLETGRAEYEAAVSAYLDALSIFPQDEHAVIRLAQALTGLGKFKEAEQAFLKATQLDPNLGATHVYYAAFLSEIGRQKEAEERLAIGQALSGRTDEQILFGTPLDPRVPPQP
jgi:tetratricopeptide (TPR) repeat protein